MSGGDGGGYASLLQQAQQGDNCTIKLEPFLNDQNQWPFMVYPWLITFGLIILYYIALKWEITLIPIVRIARREYRPYWSYLTGITFPMESKGKGKDGKELAASEHRSKDDTLRSNGGSASAIVYFEYSLLIKLDVISVNFDFNSVFKTPYRNGPLLVINIHNPEDPKNILDTIRIPLNYVFRKNVINAKTDQRVVEFIVYSSVLFDLIRIISLHHTVPGRSSAFIRIFHVDFITVDPENPERRHIKIHQEIGGVGNPRERETYKASGLSASGRSASGISAGGAHSLAPISGDATVQERLLRWLFWWEFAIFSITLFHIPLLLIHFVIKRVPYCTLREALFNGFYSGLVAGLFSFVCFVVYRWTLRPMYLTSRQDFTKGLILMWIHIVYALLGLGVGVWGFLVTSQITPVDKISNYQLAYFLSYLVIVGGVGPIAWILSYALGLFLDLPYPLEPIQRAAENETSASSRKRSGFFGQGGKSTIGGSRGPAGRTKSTLRMPSQLQIAPKTPLKSSANATPASTSTAEGELPNLEGGSLTDGRGSHRESSSARRQRSPPGEPPMAAKKDSTGSTYRRDLEQQQNNANSVSAYFAPPKEP